MRKSIGHEKGCRDGEDLKGMVLSFKVSTREQTSFRRENKQSSLFFSCDRLHGVIGSSSDSLGERSKALMLRGFLCVCGRHHV